MTPAPKELCEEYAVYTHHLATFSELEDLELPSSHSILLVAADFEYFDSKDISDTATRLIERGNAYFCAWGEGCAKAETIWDTAATRIDPQRAFGYHFVTTSHEDDTLEEAIWFALNCAFVDESIKETCSVVLISIDNPEWQNAIDEIREDPAAFNERSLKDAGMDEPDSDNDISLGLA